jgi:hypothetical protein
LPSQSSLRDGLWLHVPDHLAKYLTLVHTGNSTYTPRSGGVDAAGLGQHGTGVESCLIAGWMIALFINLLGGR